MKEWCLKHPILTFLIIDGFYSVVRTAITHKWSTTTVEDCVEVTGEVGRKMVKVIDDTEKASKEPIGFKAS